MKPIALAVLALFLTTGAACNPTCEPITVVKEVMVPVPVECEVTWPVKPAPPPEGVGFYEKGVAILKELEDNRNYAAAMAVALAKCSKNKP